MAAQRLLVTFLWAGVIWGCTSTLAEGVPLACNDTVKFNGSQSIEFSANVTKGLCYLFLTHDETVKTLALTFTSVTLNPLDYFVIYDGTENKDNLVSNLTANSEGLVVVLGANSTLLLNVGSSSIVSKVVAQLDKDCAVSEPLSGRNIKYLGMPKYKQGLAFSCKYGFQRADSGTNNNSMLALSFVSVSLTNASVSVTTPANVSNVVVTESAIPGDVYSIDSITLLLTVNSSTKPQSFNAILTAVTADSICGAQRTVDNKTTLALQVPLVPQQGYDCRIALKVETGKSLQLNVSSLNMENGRGTLTVVDGSSFFGSNILASLVTSTSDYLLFSTGPSVVVRFVADSAVGVREVIIDVLELAEVNHLVGDGQLTIPSLSSVSYFLLQANNSQKVKFDLGDELPNKTYSYTIFLFDGAQPSSAQLAVLNSKARFPVVSSGDYMLVKTEVGAPSPTLKANYTSVPAGCDRLSSGSEGSFELKGVAGMTDCTWTINPQFQISAGLQLSITSLTLVPNATLDIYGGAKASNTLLAHLKPDNFQLPFQIVLPGLAQMVLTVGDKTNSSLLAVTASYNSGLPVCKGSTLSASSGTIQTPNFPNLYPLNARCVWTFSSQVPRFLLFDFPQFDLAVNHRLTFVDNQTTVGNFSGSDSVKDLLYLSSNSTVTFQAQSPTGGAVTATSTARGFSVGYWALSCGDSFQVDSGNFSTPGYPKLLTAANGTLCVWIVSVPSANLPTNKNIVNMTILVNGAKNVNLTNVLTIHEGDTVRSLPVTTPTTSGSILSRKDTVVIMFNSSALPINIGIAVSVGFTKYKCGNFCQNGLCLHDAWRCNGVDDCGDNTDELLCTSIPTPSPAPSSSGESGVKGFVVAILFFVGVIVGVLLVVFVPKIMRKMRANRYQAFSSNDES